LSLLSSRRPSLETEIRDLVSPSVLRRSLRQSGEIDAPVWASNRKINIASSRLNREYLIREAVLLTFCDSEPGRCWRLQNVSKKEWIKLLHWLDVSGLALYFLDRMMELQLSDILPTAVLERLQQNLRDNKERTQGMIAESVAIQQAFQEGGLCYVTLKGFSLCPDSVPKPELRHQFDLDFLVASKMAADARKILERRGYRLYAISGRSWEFKRDEAPSTIRDLYKNLPYRSVELHIEDEAPGRPSSLERLEKREFQGIYMPVLSSIDLFVGQGLHAYKHVSSEFSRTSHLVEFRRHVLTRRGDDAFWKELQSRAEEDSRVSLGLGVVTLLITSAMGDFAPEALRNSTVCRLPQPARLWVKLYGRRIVYGDAPGSKLYLLLQRELESFGVGAKRSLQRALLPSRLPPPAIRASPDETLFAKIDRYSLQIRIILGRLRFHVVEGLSYARESYRWRQHMSRVIR
jgi:hypothetical protein